jgi:flagellin
MRINNNLMAMNTHRQLGISNTNAAKSMSKLSSGLRINSAADDAAGLSISEKMRGQIRGLNQASRNAQDGISLIQTAEGALNETQSILQRMRELSVQAANDTNESLDRDAIATEVDALKTEITRIADTTQFNGKNLLKGNLGVSRSGGTLDSTIVGLSSTNDINVSGAAASKTFTITETADDITLDDGDGNSQTIAKDGFAAGDTFNFSSLGVSIKTDADYDVDGTAFNGLDIETSAASGATLQIGANENQNMAIAIDDMTATGLGVNDIKVDSHGNAKAAITTIQGALDHVSTQRAALGAWQNRLEHTIKNLDTSAENLQASESRIRDVDMAKEMMEYTKNNILQQAAQAMLAQANQAPQGVLQLLR